MRAVTFAGVRRVAVVEKPEPSPIAATDAVVEVELAGLCGSDLHPYRGHEVGIEAGTTMGHEFTGRVVALGQGVRGLQEGDPVVSPFSTSCGACGPCRRGLSSRCERGELFGWIEDGRGLEGAQTAFVRVPLAESTLVPRPPELSPTEGLLLGDVVSTGRHVARRAIATPGTADGPVAVLGCGAVGLAAILHLRPSADRPVVAFDRHEVRLETARAFGARAVRIDDEQGRPRPVADLAAELRELVGPEGVGAAIDAVGSPAATALAVELLRPGGTLGIAGVHTEPHFAIPPARAYDRNLTLFIGRCPVRSSLREALDEQVRDRLPIERLVTHRLTLEEAAAAYATFDRGDAGMVKAVFTPRDAPRSS